jgi:hypothetical protein
LYVHWVLRRTGEKKEKKKERKEGGKNERNNENKGREKEIWIVLKRRAEKNMNFGKLMKAGQKTTSSIITQAQYHYSN